MGVLRVVTSDGDYSTLFTPDAHAEASALFDKLCHSHRAYKLDGIERPAIEIFDLDLSAGEILLIPRSRTEPSTKESQ